MVKILVYIQLFPQPTQPQMYQRGELYICTPCGLGKGMDFITFPAQTMGCVFFLQVCSQKLVTGPLQFLKSLAITCLYAKDKIRIKFNSYVQDHDYNVQIAAPNEVQDGIGPIPSHSLALYCTVNGLIVSLYFPSRSKIRNMLESILSLQIWTDPFAQCRMTLETGSSFLNARRYL